MAFINSSTAIGIIVGRATEYTTGDLITTLLIILLFIIAIAFMFNIKMEYTAILVFPLLLGYMAYYQAFVSVGVIFIIYLAYLLTNHWIFGK